MKGKKLLQKLLAAGVSVFVALSCMAMSACATPDEAPDGEHSGQTPEEPDDGEQGGQTPEEPDDGEQGGQTPEDPDDGEQGGQTPEEPDDGEQGGQTPEEPDDGEQGGQTPEDPEEPEHVSTPLPAENKIYVVGDSTVCSFNDNYYMPRYGYGTQIVEYFNVTSDQVVNLAISGRSSLSFLTEPNYTTLKNSIGEGDYLIIGFGHNDEKSGDAARYTNPNKSYTDDSTADGPSFQYTLYQNYVKLAKDAGATPILCTPIVRYSSTAEYSGAKIHITDKGDYSQAIRDLGEETDTTVIDLTTITKELYESDNEAAAMFHAHTSYEGEEPNETPAGRDDTHINKYGAQMVAYQFATAIAETDNTLGNYVKDGISAPTDWTIAINSGYEKPDYISPDLTQYTKVTDIAATETTSASSWYRTVVGNVGGTSKYDRYTISYNNGTFIVGNTTGEGKFASNEDGFGAAFMQVDMSTNFTITAKATVTGVASKANKQSAFGIMLRDDIYRENSGDNYAGKTSPNTNYVAAGVFQTGETIFSRENEALATVDNSGTVAEGATYELSIVRVGQSVDVTVTVGDKTYTENYTDFDFAAVDNNYMYLCLFANRGLTVEFSNVQYVVTGTSQGA